MCNVYLLSFIVVVDGGYFENTNIYFLFLGIASDCPGKF